MVPPEAHGLRAASVTLRPGAVMEWHSTRAREELLMVVSGHVKVEMRTAPRSVRTLSAGHCLFVPHHTWHRVINRATREATYLYVTASAVAR